ncbi:MAG TPA: hypothetical protein PK198_05825 [Saprospiraceae bacterium]|nr:hypothetical protein [Saprospiraceae bacterium]HRK79830.1 hypothetical protein [Saprospiraceae bacterium]
MSVEKRTAPLSNLQIELLKMYSAGVPDQYLEDLKILIARFLFAKARAKADQLWDEKKYTDELLHELLKRNGG